MRALQVVQVTSHGLEELALQLRAGMEAAHIPDHPPQRLVHGLPCLQDPVLQYPWFHPDYSRLVSCQITSHHAHEALS